MKVFLILFQLFILSTCLAQTANLPFFGAANPLVKYTGRIDFSDPAKPRFWNPGTYVTVRFRGTSCDIMINDEMLYGKDHNYLEIKLDNQQPQRLKLKEKENRIIVGYHLSNTVHHLVIVKNTEASIGYLEFVGLRCSKLLPVTLPSRKIECIGNSITCGTGSDTSVFPCGKGEWYDQHNAYLSYGPRTARALNAQYQLTAVSGIGLIHSCCDMDILMPQVFDKVSTRDNKIAWDFNKYQPDLVTICLGQNDGQQDSTVFCKTYAGFIATIRKDYPHTEIILLTSPMGDEFLKKLMIKYLGSIVKYENLHGDSRVHLFAFSKRYHGGCGGHPTSAEQKKIAEELTAYLRKLMNW